MSKGFSRTFFPPLTSPHNATILPGGSAAVQERDLRIAALIAGFDHLLEETNPFAVP
jgi:hypothetical protein